MAADYASLGLDPLMYPIDGMDPTALDNETPLTSTQLQSMIQNGDLLNNMIGSVSADKITAGIIAAGTQVVVGSQAVVIDATAPSITVNDVGTGYSIIYIGKKAGFF